MGLGLDWCTLPECPVWPRGGDMVQGDREDSASVAFVDDQNSIEQLGTWAGMDVDPRHRLPAAFAELVRTIQTQTTPAEPAAFGQRNTAPTSAAPSLARGALLV